MEPKPAARLRSLLFAPAVREDMIPKLTRSEPDGVVIDCEDATPLDQKAAGRSNALEFSPRIMGQGSEVFVRINPPGTSWFNDDVAYGLHEKLDGLVVPMVETVEALGNVDAIVATPGVDAVYVGPADLSISLGLPPGNNDDAPEFVEALTEESSNLEIRGIGGASGSVALRWPLADLYITLTQAGSEDGECVLRGTIGRCGGAFPLPRLRWLAL